MKLNNQTIKQLNKYFSTQPVLKAYLFGSYATEKADSKSDIDILVELDYTQNIGLGFIQMKIDLEDILKNKVDLVTNNSLSQYIRPRIESEKKLIYAK
jgi:hypothetical protein